MLAVTAHFEDAFEANKKCGALMIDPSSAYDVVWHRGLLLKVYNALRETFVVQVIIEIISNHCFLGADKRTTQLDPDPEEWHSQGSVLAPALFNLHTTDLPHTSGGLG